MMGLKTRLALARVLVWTGLQANPEQLTELVRQLCAGQADVIVIAQPDAAADDLRTGFRAAQTAMDSRAILGLAAPAALTGGAGADLVVSAASRAPIQAQQYALTMAAARNPEELRWAVADDQVAAVVLADGLLAEAVRLAPPSEPASKPWFAPADSLVSARALVAGGARRIALSAPSVAAAESAMAPRAVVRAYRELLRPVWSAEMEQVSMAAFGRS